MDALEAAAIAPASASPSGSEPSNTASSTPALSAAAMLRSTPRRSASPAASRSPAVSVRRSSTPPSRAFSSIVSRVVPGSAVTMARSQPRMAFMSELLPAFGRPMSAQPTPSRSTRPREKVPMSLSSSDTAASSREA